MNDLLAVSIVLQHNFRVLHWKVSTPDFDSIHSLMDSYVSKFDELIDFFAEATMMMGEQPLSFHNIIDTLRVNNIELKSLDSNINYTPAEVFEVTGFLLSQLQELVRNKLNSELPPGIKSELETIEFWITKELNYKNKQRLS